MHKQPYLTLNDGHRMPQLGFGVWQVSNDEVVEPVLNALETGYRSIDTAQGYGNEAGVGEAIRRSGVTRSDIFVTSKLRNKEHGFDSTLRAFDDTMAKLGLDVLNLFLIHWPVPSQDLYVESWEALVRLREEGRVKSIGVSNFLPEHVNRILERTGVVPAINQIEIHPLFQQRGLRDFHKLKTIQLEAYSPLGSGAVLDNPAIAQIAQKHGKSPAQAILRWHVQEGVVVIPKSTHAERIAENFDVFDFELDAEDMAAIRGLDDPAKGRTGADPKEMAVLF